MALRVATGTCCITESESTMQTVHTVSHVPHIILLSSFESELGRMATSCESIRTRAYSPDFIMENDVPGRFASE
jgi:hypothetical protein